MCGIVGVLRFGDLENKELREASIFMGTNLLELTEPRGKDATGIVTIFDDSNFFGQKMGVSATDFIARFGGKSEDFDAFIKIVRDYGSNLRTIIGHCRKKSVGGAFDNVNNHPIKAGNIVGVHNGTLTNHEEIFKNLNCKRDGDVDSEAIMRLFEFYTKGCKEPFTIDMLDEVAKRLNGSFSVLIANTNNPNQVISMRDTRPAEYCLIKPLKMVLIASEKKFFEHAIWAFNKSAALFGHDDFEIIKKKDVEFATLPDETAALFNLTIEITPETKLCDLYETKKLVPTVDRIWKIATKAAGFNNGYENNRYNNGYSNGYSGGNQKPVDNGYKKPVDNFKKETQSGETVVNKTDATKTENKTSNGKVWSELHRKFIEVDTAEEIKGSNVADLEKKQVTSLDQASADVKEDFLNGSGKTLKKVIYANEEFEGGLPRAEIVNTKVKSTEEVKSKTGDKNDVLKAIKESAKFGKNDSKDVIEAQKASIEAVKFVTKYNTDADVADLCDASVAGLCKLSFSALTNRIVRSVFNSIYQNGWMDKCSSNKDDTESQLKVQKSQKHVRVLKTLATSLGSTAFLINSEEAKIRIKDMIANLPLNSEINEENIKSVFNAGDFRTNPAMKSIVLALEEDNIKN